MSDAWFWSMLLFSPALAPLFCLCRALFCLVCPVYPLFRSFHLSLILIQSLFPVQTCDEKEYRWHWQRQY